MKIIEEILYKIFNCWTFRYWVMSPIRCYYSLCGKFLYRPFIKFAADYFKDKKVVGVEIGVFKGTFSRMLLRKLNIGRLYLIDPYFRYDGYKDDLGTENFSKLRATAHKKLSVFPNKMFIRTSSEEAAGLFKEGSLAFVYIDGNHNYEYVKKDIELYWSKVKKGGLIGGHDMDGSFLGVCRAVVEFANKKKVTIHGEQNEWWIIKT